jgi:hypothetical protein
MHFYDAELGYCSYVDVRKSRIAADSSNVTGET